MNIPEIINKYNVYIGNNSKSLQKLIGISGAVSLPSLEMKTATVSGAGLLGDLDVPAIGQFGNLQLDIPFNMLYGDIFTIFSSGTNTTIWLRGSEQIRTSEGTLKHVPLVISVRGMVKTLNPGKLEGASAMDASVSLNLTYIRIRVEDKEVLHIDKLNSQYIVNGKDLLAEINANC